MKKVIILSFFAFSITDAFAQTYPQGQIVFQNSTDIMLAYQATTQDGRIANTACFSNGAQGFNWHNLTPSAVLYKVRISTCTNGDPDQGSNNVWSTPVVGTSQFNPNDYYVWNCTDTGCTAQMH